jgi:hypothetical protein
MPRTFKPHRCCTALGKLVLLAFSARSKISYPIGKALF